MCPIPPASSEGFPLPSRHRPALGDLAKDTMETDLWALDDDLVLEEETTSADPTELGRERSAEIPATRERKVSSSRIPDVVETAPPRPLKSGIQMDVRKQNEKVGALGEIAGPAKPENDFDDLEQWEDIPHKAESDKLPDTRSEEIITAAPMPTDPLPEVESSKNPVSDHGGLPPVPRQGTFPISLQSYLGLTKLEKTGILVLLVLLTICGLLVYGYSINRIPTESRKAKTNDFPIKGAHLILDSVGTYWRAPIVEGPSPDLFRRGTELLPVVEFAVGGGYGAIRVVFHDENQKAVGDSITREIQGRGRVKVASTAGFEDVGMFAAYRTGDKKPWTIEVLEGPSADAPSTDFKKLFEMNLSTENR